ncbi:hypothetical protein IAQ61_009977 [Plenodomus lingam]|uniref:uncharacterized protein n=1 Tax=Leptosphaeria maculans TaxID=5022 RepID=UPI00331853A5|nr:hypothetical protein IAQ61_009977 [Plenodomus lingam]
MHLKEQRQRNGKSPWQPSPNPTCLAIVSALLLVRAGFTVPGQQSVVRVIMEGDDSIDHGLSFSASKWPDCKSS